MNSDPKDFFKRYNELVNLYCKVKELALRAENISGKVILTNINEIRAAFDHLFKTPISESRLIEFEGAKRHVKRAGYDACEIISIYLVNDIETTYQNFDIRDIVFAYSKYLKDKIKVQDIYKLLATVRKDTVDEKNNTTENNNADRSELYYNYEKLLEEFYPIYKRMMDHVPLIIDAEKANKKRKRKGYIINFLIAFSVAIISIILTWIVTKLNS